MRLPKMILFDYGQTLIAEEKFNGVKGTREVLKYAVKNKHNLSAEQVQAHADRINKELGRFDSANPCVPEVEIPNSTFTPYLYESVGIELSIDCKERDRIFWDAAAPGKPTEGIENFLDYLRQKEIRTGVISNVTYDSDVVKERIHRLIPNNQFEFIIATSSFLYRKPNRHIFELALEKADLKAEEVWYIGDNFICDIQGALAAGLFPVWYLGAKELPYSENETVWSVFSWSELMDKMGKLGSSIE